VSLFCFPARTFSADEIVKIKILAVNPSPTEKLDTIIKQPLPPEVGPEDVVESAGMEIKFNKEAKVYEVSKAVQLGPKEAKTIEIRVKNVWVISEDEIAEMKKRLEQNASALKGTNYEKAGDLLFAKLTDKLDRIEAEKGKKLGIKQRIDLYRAQKKEMEEIETQAVSFDALRRLQSEQEQGVRTAKFVITATNSAKETKTLTVRAALPADVTADGVIDKLDFNLLYDNSISRFNLEKEDEFQGGETKKYEIILRDIWYIPQTDLDLYKTQTDKLLEHFKGTTYEKYASNISNFVFETLAAITTRQEESSGSSVEDRIRTFVLNTQKVEIVKGKLKELQNLLLEIPLKTNPTVMDEFKRAMKEFQKTIGKVLSMGFQPNLSTTWWIILGIIAFLFLISTTFYVNWIMRLNESKWGKKAAQPKKQAKEISENTETQEGASKPPK
jgi:hypothetical protein